MKKYIIAAALALASPAGAATFNIEVNGTITSQGTEQGPNNTGADQNLAVGSPITLTASFDASLLVPWGNFGYSVVGLDGFPTTGGSFFRIDAPGLTWQASDNIQNDATAMFKYDDAPTMAFQEYLPAIIIQGDKVVGLVGILSPNNSSAPALSLGSAVQPAWQEFGMVNGERVEKDNFKTATLSDIFSIYAASGVYGNSYGTQGFTGTWDFADSSVIDPPSPAELLIASAVPEPATWALFLLGFGGIGWMLRRTPGAGHAEANQA